MPVKTKIIQINKLRMKFPFYDNLHIKKPANGLALFSLVFGNFHQTIEI